MRLQVLPLLDGIKTSDSYRAKFAANLLPDLRHVIADPRNSHVGIYGQLGLET